MNYDDLKVLTAAERSTLSVVVDILFPAEPDGIGAMSAGAVCYIDRVLSERAAYLAEVYKAGVRWLHHRAQSYGEEHFDELRQYAQEEIVNEVMARCQATPTPLDLSPSISSDREAADDNSPSPDLLFMTAVWQHTREALFGDPRHGGNREGKIWKWLGYNGPQLHGYTDSEILENETPHRPLRFAEDWRNHRG